MPLDGMNDWDLASLSSSLRDAREELRLKQLEEASHHFRQNWVMGLLLPSTNGDGCCLRGREPKQLGIYRNSVNFDPGGLIGQSR